MKWFEGLKFAWLVCSYTRDEGEAVILYSDVDDIEEVRFLASACVSEPEECLEVTRQPHLDGYAETSQTLDERRSFVMRIAMLSFVGDKRCKYCRRAEMLKCKDRQGNWTVCEKCFRCGECVCSCKAKSEVE